MMKKEFFSWKKNFHLFESLFYKNGKAQKIPVAAARLLKFSDCVCVVGLVDTGDSSEKTGMLYQTASAKISKIRRVEIL